MSVRVLVGNCLDVLKTLPSESVQTCITSPPYFGLRSYGIGTENGEIGLEKTPAEYVEKMVEVFREVRRVLRDDGTVWLNLGDSYASNGERTNNNGQGASGLKNDGRDEASRARSNARIKTAGMTLPRVSHNLKPKDLLMIPAQVALALRADGWWLRSEIIWAKPNPMPESVTDRPTKSHEQIFLLTKSPSYFYDAAAIAEEASASTTERWGGSTVARRGGGAHSAPDRNDYDPAHKGASTCGVSANGRNRRSVWTVATEAFSGAHFATFPTKLIEPCILAGTSPRACEVCGAAWVRVVGTEGADMTARYARGEPSRHGTAGAAASKASNVGGFSGARTSLGFAPSCSCPSNSGTARSVVLDPFAGAGTALMVADRLGRDAIGIELNPTYAEMARERVKSDCPLFTDVA
jgi:DNA modification methylase